jgi:N-acetylmuramoyl-L-alanine amidase
MIMKRAYLCAILGMYLLILLTVFLVIRWNEIVHLFNHKAYTIVIDAGHGGFDPGKIGINHALEKDINLSVAIKLKHLLEENDVHVIMTREEDKGLASKLYRNNEKQKTTSLMFNKKQTDMRKRISIINSSDASIAVSIHQNSFVEESSWGAQVFYYQNSGEGKILAETIQERMKKTLGDGNHRLAKANSSYYLMKNSNCPLVIVECGFLSNWKEAELLCEDAYQDKLAWAIHLGILEYLNQSEKEAKTGIAKE